MAAQDPSTRRGLLESSLVAAQLDGLLVSSPANVRYLSGFTGSNGWLLLQRDARPLLFTDGRYREQAAAQARGCRVEICADGLVPGLAATVTGEPRLGFESAHLSHAAVVDLTQTVDTVRWLPTRDHVEDLRARKSDMEIAAVRAALELAESVLVEVVAELSPGVTEAAVAAEIDHRCRLRGARRMAFDTIVAAGPRAANPHAVPSTHPIPPGVPVVVDLGCELDGYCSDITRCVVLGEALAPEWQLIHAVVSRAREAALGVMRPGVAAAQVDRAARDVLGDAGLGEAFVHGLGHGVGLEVHEAPRLAARSEDTLQAGMVVTIEPGVYLPGLGGMRLEDLAVVREDGAERLNRLSDAPLGGG